jgi:Tfp pilus assembly protein PilE
MSERPSLQAGFTMVEMMIAMTTYVTDLAPLFGLSAGSTVYSGDNNDSGSAYRITAAAAPGGINTGYTLTATQNGGHSDPDCGNLTLTSTGVKGKSGPADLSRCW